MKKEATVFVKNNCELRPIPATVDGVDQIELSKNALPIQSGKRIQITEERSALIAQPLSELDGRMLDVVKLEGHLGWYIKTAFLF